MNNSATNSTLLPIIKHFGSDIYANSGAPKQNQRYRQTQDQIVVTVPRGAREGIKKHAAQKDKSVKTFIVELVEKDMGCAMNELAEAAKEETIK